MASTALKTIFRRNQSFFWPYIAFVLIALVLLSQLQHGDEIVFFSDHRSWLGDWFFKIMTRVGEEIFYTFLFVVLLFVRVRYALLVPVTGLLVALTAYATKVYFAQDRPSLYFGKMGVLDQLHLVDGVTLLSGDTSFPSGHTISAFALATLWSLIITGRYPRAGFWLFAVALCIGVSRIYLVQHFLRDVLAGSLFGVIIATIVYSLQTRVPYRAGNWLEKAAPLPWRKHSRHTVPRQSA